MRIELPGTMIEAIATTAAVLPHAAVGQLPHMPVTYACRVYLESVAQSAFVHHLLHHGVSCGRTADVAQTDKKKFGLVFRLNLSHKIVNFVWSKRKSTKK